MTRRTDCPPWCAQDVPSAIGVQHQVVVGDVRLTRVDASGSRRTTCSVRRRSGRSPAQVARLDEDVAAVSGLLRTELRHRRTVFRDNYAVSPHAEGTPGRVGSLAAVGWRNEALTSRRG